MILKAAKIAVIGAGVTCLVGAFVLRKDVVSSVNSVRSAIKENVPIEFELQRSRDFLDQIIPQMYANIHLVAAEEVELAAMKQDIRGREESMVEFLHRSIH